MKVFASRSRRFVVTGVHLLASCCVAVLASIVVFGVWYPPPYASIAAGGSLFLLLMSVDVILGPALTAVVADAGKPVAVLRRDLIAIVVVQLMGLAYGMYSIALARPVYLAFEVDRMRVVTAADIDGDTLSEAEPAFRRLPWTGPQVIAAVRPTRPDEVLKSIDLALGGYEISLIPQNWRDYESQRAAVLHAARPAAELRTKYPAVDSPLGRIAAKAEQPVESLRFLPVVSRHASWIALIAAPDARVVGFLPVDGFF